MPDPNSAEANRAADCRAGGGGKKIVRILIYIIFYDSN